MSALMQTIHEGFKQTEVGIIPDDWNSASLHEICSFGGGTTPPRSQHDRYFVGGNNNWIKTTDLNNSLLEISEEQITDLAIAETGLKKHPVGSVLVAMYGGFNQIGRTGYITQPSSINQALVAVKPKPKKLHSYYLLSELNYNVDYWKGVASSSRKDPNITSNDVKNYKIALPSVEEQTAIANALSDVDTLLTELEKLIAKKQAIKTATMQQLLTGKTRLPQFSTYTDGAAEGKSKRTKPSELGEIPEDWEVSTIGDISLVPMQNGLFYEPARKGKGVPLINVSDMYTSAPISVESLELFNASKTELKAFKVNEGDLFFTRSSIVPSGIAFCNVLPKSDKEVVFDSHLIRVRVDPKIADYNYVYLNCLAKHSRLHLIANSKTATMTTIDQKAINCCPVLLPCKEEQTAIATILSDMDNEIQTLEQRLTKTRQIKQGMMQQLLTGRTRLPY